MASDSLPTPRLEAIAEFHYDARRLERRDWQLWGIASLFLAMMFTTIAALALEIEHRGVEFLSGAQLDAAVRGLLVLVLCFTLFIVYQQLTLSRMRQLLVEELARGLAANLRGSEASGD
jgi:hypothetical protein